MAKDERNLLAVLKAELEFVQKGGYRYTARSPWRPQFIFQDSPTCLNFDSTQPRRPCSECVLMELVPPDLRNGKIPCRHIPLNAKGETIDSLYRTGTQMELETALTKWLKSTIKKLELESAQAQQGTIGAAVGKKAAAN